MLSVSRYQAIKGMLFVLISMNIGYVYGEEKKYTIDQKFFFQHYPSFKNSVFEKIAMVNIGRLLGKGVIKKVAERDGYDPFAIECIHHLYPLCDRPKAEVADILYSIGTNQENLQHVNMLFEKCGEKPGDLNWIVRVTHDEGNRLEQEKIKRTGHVASAREKDTFVAIGLFLRYVIKNKLVV
jgi:hypothetical protein